MGKTKSRQDDEADLAFLKSVKAKGITEACRLHSRPKRSAAAFLKNLALADMPDDCTKVQNRGRNEIPGGEV